MIQKFEIQGVHYDIDESLKKYVTKKIGGLDKYISKHSRASVHAEVRLKENKAKNNTHCNFEATIYLPHETINVKESAFNMYAAVDITEAKLKLQLKKYKDTRQSGKTHRHIFARLRRKSLQAG